MKVIIKFIHFYKYKIYIILSLLTFDSSRFLSSLLLFSQYNVEDCTLTSKYIYFFPLTGFGLLHITPTILVNFNSDFIVSNQKLLFHKVVAFSLCAIFVTLKKMFIQSKKQFQRSLEIIFFETFYSDLGFKYYLFIY